MVQTMEQMDTNGLKTPSHDLKESLQLLSSVHCVHADGWSVRFDEKNGQ